MLKHHQGDEDAGQQHLQQQHLCIGLPAAGAAAHTAVGAALGGWCCGAAVAVPAALKLHSGQPHCCGKDQPWLAVAPVPRQEALAAARNAVTPAAWAACKLAAVAAPALADSAGWDCAAACLAPTRDWAVAGAQPAALAAASVALLLAEDAAVAAGWLPHHVHPQGHAVWLLAGLPQIHILGVCAV